MSNQMTLTEARARILGLLSQDWHSCGQVARFLGIQRSSVEREVSSLRAMGRLEARTQRFHRNGDWRVGSAYKVAVVECGPVELGR